MLDRGDTFTLVWLLGAAALWGIGASRAAHGRSLRWKLAVVAFWIAVLAIGAMAIDRWTGPPDPPARSIDERVA